MTTCRTTRALIARTIDAHPLPAAARTTLRQHLLTCARCRAEYDTQHAVRRLLTLHIEEQPPPGFEARLNARLAQVSPVSRSPKPWRTWMVRVLAVAATLALIAADPRMRDAARLQRAHASQSRNARDASPIVPIKVVTSRRPMLRPPAAAPPKPTSVPEPAAPADTMREAETAGLADALKLTETQRKQIAAIDDQRRQALERVLTPGQRKQYRARSTSRDRNAREGWTVLPLLPTQNGFESQPELILQRRHD